MLKPSNDELYHFGVKGQKRGIRQYQNLDGTWTELGKERRRKGTGYIQGIDNDENKVYNRKGFNVFKDIPVEAVYIFTAVGIGALGAYLGNRQIGKQIEAEMSKIGTYTVNSQFKSVLSDKVIDAFKNSDFRFKSRETDAAQDVQMANMRKVKNDPYWNNNCGCSSIVQYLRRNGLDVTANKLPDSTIKGLTIYDIEEVFPGFVERYNSIQIKDWIAKNTYCKDNPKAYAKLLSKRICSLSDSDNTFGMIGCLGGSEHWFTWEKHGTDVLFTDPQNGKIITGDHRIFEEIASGVTTIDTYIRIDDLNINPDAAKMYIQSI